MKIVRAKDMQQLAYFSESSWSEKECRKTVLEILDTLDLPQSDRDYVLSYERMCTWLYVMGAWQNDESLRRGLTHAICMHCFGIKLLDDIIDDDVPCSHGTLGLVSSLLTEASYLEMSKLGVIEDYFLKVPRSKFHSLWKDQLDLNDLPSSTLADWEKFSQLRTGLMMEFYTDFISMFGDYRLTPEQNRQVFIAIGDVWTAFDDIRDKAADKAAGANRNCNITLLIEREQILVGDVRAMLDDRERIVREIVADVPPALDFLPYFDSVLGRCRQFLDKEDAFLTSRRAR